MDGKTLMLIALFMFVGPVAFVGSLALWNLRAWLRAKRQGLDLSVFEIIGMRLQRMPIDDILAAIALAQQHGHTVLPISLKETLRAGLNLLDVTQAFIEGRKENSELTFDEVIRTQSGLTGVANNAATDGQK